jgi:hypothetical protein
MNETAQIRVLLVGDSPEAFSSCRRRLETIGCRCEFAECEREVWNVLEQRQFDIVLSVHRGRGSRTEAWGPCCLVRGLPSSMHYRLKKVAGGCLS